MAEQSRDFKGVWIPKEIWLCKDLSALDRVIYAEIDSLDNENHCTAGNEYFAEFCGVGEATVTRSIQKLIEKGYIEKVSFDGRHRVLKVIKESNQNDESPSSKRLTNNIDNNQTNKEDIITINSNNTEIKDDYESHGYSNEDLKSEFLGSVKKRPVQKRKSLYDKCVDEVYKYTKNLKLQSVLLNYLSVRLSIKDKPIYGVNQWVGMLNRLSEISGESVLDDSVENRVVITEQSIEKGWASFYELKTGKKNIDKVSSEYGVVSCEKEKEENIMYGHEF